MIRGAGSYFAMYIFDYGAPVGMRLALWHPERIDAIISQNGNCYEEGLGKKWEARNILWSNMIILGGIV